LFWQADKPAPQGKFVIAIVVAGAFAATAAIKSPMYHTVSYDMI
jgi:hypothetical protein